nr:phospholipase D3-like isoform X1 [Pogona vitticeps]XP_020653101.1 phospholipase D3-like isoform X2 [Pogona vitticeps]
MRKKDPARRESRDTPLRRSSRLQPEKVEPEVRSGDADKQVSREPPSLKGSRSNDILQPRESIKAHRKRVDLSEDDSPPDPLRGPLPQSEPEARKDDRPSVSESESPLSPFVRLRRLAAPPEEEIPGRRKGEEELQKPNLDWEVVKDERARLWVLETRRPQSMKGAPPAEEVTPSLQSPVENKALGKPARAGIGSRAGWGLRMEKTAPSMLRAEVLPAGKPSRKGILVSPQRFRPLTALYFLLFLLVMGFACWFVWKHGIPGAWTGLMGYGQWKLSSFPSLWSETEECSNQCRVVLVESLPANLHLKSPNPSIYQAWVDLLAEAHSSVEIAAFYFTLRDSDIHVQDPSSQQGKAVFEALRGLPARGVKLSIAVNSPQLSENDTDDLARHGAEVRYVNMKRLTGGVVHTKFWVVDHQHVYIGSANMDWRSLTQVKELGAVIYNCSCLATDLHRIFAIYRLLGEEGASVPASWPGGLAAKSSLRHPLKLQLNGTDSEVYLSSSPPALCSKGRTSDLTAILSTIKDAEDFVYIAVMEYEPQCSFCKPKRFWPVIDDALRAAACERGVNVRLLLSCWRHSRPSMFVFLESLSVLSREPLGCPIEVKLFVVPSGGEQPPIPYAHVSHNKYMVTDRLAYIGTSNWSEDYFVNTTGVGLVVSQRDSASAHPPGFTLRQQLEEVFLRDWTSAHAKPLSRHRECAKA